MVRSNYSAADQQLLDIDSRMMSCIRSHCSYTDLKGEEDPLSGVHSSDTLIVMFLKYVFCYFSGIEFPCDVKVIISVVNPEHLKLPVFAGIVMEQFRLGAGAGAGLVDEQKKAQDIHSSRRAKSAVAAAI